MNKHFTIVFKLSIFFLSLAYASQASAALVYTDDNRRIESLQVGQNAYDPQTPVERPESNFGYWDTYSYYQVSDLQDAAFNATGRSSSYLNNDYFETHSFFDVNFNLTSASLINLTGNLSAFVEFNGSPAIASIDLYHDTTLLFSESVSQSQSCLSPDTGYLCLEEQASFSFNELLQAGNYRIVAAATSTNYFLGESYYSLNASISPTAVPLPASIYLLFTGLLSLFGLSKHSFNRRSKFE